MTKRKSVWIFIASAIFLTALQRSFTYYELLSAQSLPMIEFSTEYMALYIAILMLFGIAGLHPLFHSLNKSHEEVKRSEAKYRTLLENLPQSIYLKHLRGGDLVYTSCNENFARDVNTPASEIEDKSDRDLFPAEIAERVEEDDKRVFQKGEIEEQEFEREEDGDTVYIHSIKTPLKSSEGKAYGLLVVYWDITEQKKAEIQHEKLREKMQQTQKLEGLGVLAGGIAHDFNNLLTGILGNTYLAQKELPEESPTLSGIREIESAANRAAELTNQMLAYSGQGQYMLQRIDLGQELDSLKDLINASISKKALLEFDVDAESKPFINVDPTQIRQIIVNLTTNASEAIGDTTGLIRISAGVKSYAGGDLQNSIVNFEKLEPGEYVYLKVADTGCGFEEDETGKLFEPFHTTKFTGRGLGLAAVLGIVRSQNGGIMASSQADSGSTFTVLFPRADSSLPLETEEMPSQEMPTEGTGNVLLVDDERVVRQVAKRLIEIAGFQVVTASNGPDAIETFQTNRENIDCVILDMTMPIMNGVEVLREIKKIDESASVILSSGYNESDIASRVPSEKLSAFVKKPYNYKKLYNAITQAIRNHRDSV